MHCQNRVRDNSRHHSDRHFCDECRPQSGAGLFKTARVLHLSRAETLRTIVIPAAIPEIVSGLRIGFSLTLLGVLIGEMFASQRGLGYTIMNAIGLHDVPTIMAVILLLAIFAVLANAVLLWLDHRLHHRAA